MTTPADSVRVSRRRIAPFEVDCNSIFRAVHTTYLVLLSPNIQIASDREALKKFVDLAPTVSHQSVGYLIEHGNSWRERLIGLTLAGAIGPEHFCEQTLAGLEQPSGYEVIPSFALLYLAFRDLMSFDVPERLMSLDPGAAHGEVGWGVRKLLHLLKISDDEPGDVSPITGLHFHFYLEAFEWLDRARK